MTGSRVKANKSLVIHVKKMMALHNSVTFQHVKGHDGHQGNERVNAAAPVESARAKLKLQEPVVQE